MNMLQICVGGRGRAIGLTCLFTHRAVGQQARFEGIITVTPKVRW